MDSEDTALLLAFYAGTGTDHKGRTVGQLVQKPDRWLEETHDYIQWLFPLYAPSQFNPHAPLLTDEVCAAFRDPLYPDHLVLQANFQAAIRRMLAFYGYSINLLSPTEVEGTGDWDEQSEHWLTPGNHNQMRITRMLRSMYLLGRAPLARSWQRSLFAVGKAHPEAVSMGTLRFWAEAVPASE
jgi:hypothetical protein